MIPATRSGDRFALHNEAQRREVVALLMIRVLISVQEHTLKSSECNAGVKVGPAAEGVPAPSWGKPNASSAVVELYDAKCAENSCRWRLRFVRVEDIYTSEYGRTYVAGVVGREQDSETEFAYGIKSARNRGRMYVIVWSCQPARAAQNKREADNERTRK